MNQQFIKHALATAAVMVVFSIVGTALLAYTFETTKAPIAASEIASKLEEFAQVLPANEHDNDLMRDSVKLATGTLGNREETQAHIAKLAGKPQAVVLEATAHDGYSGDIKLLIAVRVDGSVAGVRVIAHKETPGLGDYIDTHHGNWIKCFDNLSYAQRPADLWRVKKDGGAFDYMAGATITPRAVVKAVKQTLDYVQQQHAVFFAAQG
jgi:Na+-translocating ferredoxin:NAD+ oxidoreductase subunit G